MKLSDIDPQWISLGGFSLAGYVGLRVQLVLGELERKIEALRREAVTARSEDREQLTQQLDASYMRVNEVKLHFASLTQRLDILDRELLQLREYVHRRHHDIANKLQGLMPLK